MNHVAVFLASGGYAGFFPIAPGTVGSAVGLVLFWALRAWTPWWTDGAAVLVALIAGIWAAGVTERVLQREDPGPVVIDEVLGMFLTVMFLPVNLMGALTGFVLFRIFDVLKPFPADRAERLHGGWGIMLDDAVAGLYAHLLLRALIVALPGLLT